MGKRVYSYLWAVCLLLCAAALLASTSARSYAAGPGCATIGGSIWEGGQMPDGSPQMTGNKEVLAAKVMVQDMESGDVVTYGTVTGNKWSAQVPAPAEYVVMFAAPNYDLTSREFKVICNNDLKKDAYLAPLPLQTANMLVYAFRDNYVNGEDDYPIDTALKGVTFIVKDEDGNTVATGVSGFSPTLPAGAGPDPDGLYFFTGLKPGDYHVSVDMSKVPQYNPGAGTDWYLTTSEEGGHSWEISLYPGDPGTSAGGYYAWFGLVEKIGKSAPAPGTGTISGVLKDGDGPWFADEPFNPPTNLVTPNYYVPNGMAILYTDSQVGEPHPVATVEADPVNGTFKFENVPPGTYKIFSTDLPLDYIWQEAQVTVAPGQDVTGVEIFLPRWYARVSGYVTDVSSTPPAPVAGAKVRMRLEDGSIWKEETTDDKGWYNFDKLEEVEVLGFVDVEPPSGYRGTLDAAGNNLMTRTVQWYTYNHRADLQIEKIPANEGIIKGFVHNDNLVQGTWVPNGTYEPKEERTIHGTKVELFDSTGQLLKTISSGGIDETSLVAQGWMMPYTWPPDEFGGVFNGQIPGYYEFRGLTPGATYTVKVTPPNGFAASPAGSDVKTFTASAGGVCVTDFGFSTQAPLAGEIEGGVFDDINLDTNPLSLLEDEKAGIVGAPVGIYDQFGYLLGSGRMGSPLCYPGSTVCPPGEPIPQKPEMERRAAPGPHIYISNDPALPGFNPGYDPLPVTYNFDQGKNKFEADWSNQPIAFNGLGAAVAGNGVINPANAPALANVAVVAQNGAEVQPRMLALNGGATMSDAGSVQVAMLAPVNVQSALRPPILRLTGRNFGDKEGNSTVTLGGHRLTVRLWSDTSIDVAIMPNSVSGALVVATSTGISNSLPVNIKYIQPWEAFLSQRSVFVDGSFAGTGNGTKASPYTTIAEALSHLPAALPRYVFVAPGTYRENIRIAESNVKLIGSGPQETVIEGAKSGLVTVRGFEGGGPVIYIGRGGMTGSVSNVSISGFTITGGRVKNDIGGGIFADYGNNDVDVNNCIITRNSGPYGGGMWLHKSNHNVSIWSNIIAENGNDGGYGGGISVNDEPEYGPQHGEPEHTVDDHNPGPPPGIYRISNNLIFHNYSSDYGGGICLYEVKDMLNVTGNMVMENRSYDHGGGMFLEDTGPAEISGNVFLRNYANDDGGAISFEDVGDDISTLKIFNNLIAENIVDDVGENNALGAGLAFDDTFYAEVYNNTITGNVVAGALNPRGGAIDAERNGHEYLTKPPGFSNPRIYNNIIWENWRLEYDRPHTRKKEAGTFNYTTGINYRWTPDNLHVDNPALQGEWQRTNNSESFTDVNNNIISGSYSNGTGNISAAPGFVDPAGLDWHLRPGSPALGKAPVMTAPKLDIDKLRRLPAPNGMVDLGAYEYQNPGLHVVRIPTGILGAIKVPRP